jgi:hypothetical protein
MLQHQCYSSIDATHLLAHVDVKHVLGVGSVGSCTHAGEGLRHSMHVNLLPEVLFLLLER